MRQDFTLVDAALVPWFTRMAVLEHYRSFHLPPELTRARTPSSPHPALPPTQKLESLMRTVGGLSRWHSSAQGCADCGACMGQLAGWAQRASQRASVLDSEVAPPGSQDYRAALLQHYSRYADASANSTSARDFK